jgi:hypothetical protein
VSSFTGPLYYLCAFLASSPARLIVKSYTLETSTSTHILQNLNIAAFDPASTLHRRLAELSKQAHALAVSLALNDELAELEREIDTAAAELWGIIPAELAEIQSNLKELG